MEKEKSNEVSEQVRFIGDLAEKKILAQEKVFLQEPERKWLKGLLERQGEAGEQKVIFDMLDQERFEYENGEFKLTVHRQQCDTGHFIHEEGKGVVLSLAAQTYYLEGMLGRERLLDVMSKVVTDLAKENKEMVENYIRTFLNNALDDQKKGVGYSISRAYNDGKSGGKKPNTKHEEEIKWKIEAMHTLEASISGLFRVLEVLNSGFQEEAEVRQQDKYVSWDLRERILKANRTKEENKGIEYGRGEKLRALPNRGIGLLLESLVTS